MVNAILVWIHILAVLIWIEGIIILLIELVRFGV